MKKYYVLIFTASLVLSFVIFSCDKEDAWPDDLKKDFEAAAILHTEAMEASLDALKKAPAGDPSALLLVVEEAVTRHVAQNPGFAPHHEYANNGLEAEVKRLYRFRKMVGDPNYKGEYEYNDFLLYTIHDHQDDLSEAQYNLLLSVNSIMATYSTEEEIVPMLTQIQDVDCLALPEEERYVIYSAITIGIESVGYWNAHIDEWIAAFTDGDPDKIAHLDKWFNWGSIVGSDVAGGVGGAIGGAIAGSFAGGIGAGPGAIAGGVGGAAGTSATDAVMQIIGHIF